METSTYKYKISLKNYLFSFFSKPEQNLFLLRDEEVIIHIANFCITVFFTLQHTDEDLLFMRAQRI